MEASYSRCMDVQERMRLHSLLSLASEVATGAMPRRVASKALTIVEKKMVDIVSVEEDRKEKFDVETRGHKPSKTPLSSGPRRTLFSTGL